MYSLRSSCERGVDGNQQYSIAGSWQNIYRDSDELAYYNKGYLFIYSLIVSSGVFEIYLGLWHVHTH